MGLLYFLVWHSFIKYMEKKKLLSLFAVLCMVIALMMYTAIDQDHAAHGFFWIPLLLGAVLLFAANRSK